ncbi:MAG: DUF4388 domain-containing protein [Acidobacteria bacterium]|nr:DUF4388 domain-containing protein [Acidobacteriota bacterium]
MGISGNLRTMSPGDLLQWLNFAQKTGTLVLTAGGVEKKIFFREGRVISSASTDPREYLGQFLMSHGYITEEQLTQAMKEQARSKRLLGRILVDLGVVPEKELGRLMREKAEESIYEIFLWKEAEFHFIDNELPNMEMVPLQVDVTGIIMEGARRIDEWKRISRLIPGRDAIPEALAPIDTAELPDVNRRIIEAVNGHRSIEELILESRSSHFKVARTIYVFLEAGQMHLVKRVKAPEGRTVSAEIRAVRTEADEIASLLGHAQEALRAGDFDKTLRMLKAAQNVDPTDAKIASALKGTATVIMNALEAEGVVAKKVPRLVKTIDEISQMNFTPNEGFMISRINGTWDIGSIVKISPLREIDSLLIFRKLQRDGIVKLT